MEKLDFAQLASEGKWKQTVTLATKINEIIEYLNEAQMEADMIAQTKKVNEVLEPVEPKEERCPNCDTVGCICTMQFDYPRREPKEKSLRDGDIPCFKCSKRHPDNWNCEYNLTYQRYLLDELSRVERVLKSKN